MTRPYNSAVRRPVAVALQEAEWLAESGASLSEVCDHLGIKPGSLWTYCHRRDRADLYWRLASREPDAEQRQLVSAGIQRRKEVA